MIMVLVGAINVSAIETKWHGLITGKAKKVKRFSYENENIVLARGEEMGRFNLGSTVIVLATEKMRIADTISAGAPIKLGQCLAKPA